MTSPYEMDQKLAASDPDIILLVQTLASALLQIVGGTPDPQGVALDALDMSYLLMTGLE